MASSKGHSRRSRARPQGGVLDVCSSEGLNVHPGYRRRSRAEVGSIMCTDSHQQRVLPAPALATAEHLTQPRRVIRSRCRVPAGPKLLGIPPPRSWSGPSPVHWHEALPGVSIRAPQPSHPGGQLTHQDSQTLTEILRLEYARTSVAHQVAVPLLVVRVRKPGVGHEASHRG